jgi:hypothetical protein
MPPQQADGLLDLVDELFGFRAHKGLPVQEIAAGFDRRGP